MKNPSDTIEWPMEAACLQTSLGMIGNGIHSSSVTSYNEGPLRPNDRVTSSLATWLWLWKTNEGERWARELGDAWLMPLLSKVLVRRTGAAQIWTLDMELSHEDTDRARLEEVIDHYRALAKTPWPDGPLDLGHLPALLLLEARSGPRAVPAGSRLGIRTETDPDRRQDDPLWELIHNNDQTLLDWWLNDPAFTPSVINSYRVDFGNKDVLSHRLDDEGWVALWLRHGASPAGASELPPSRRPLFQASSPAVVERLLAAGADPDSLDEQGRLPDEMRPGLGRPVLATHPIFQARRQALGRADSITDAHRRHQFAQWALATAAYPAQLDSQFERAIKRGPLPRWKSQGHDIGLAEWLVRNAREQYANMVGPLLSLARQQMKLRDSLDQVGTAQVPDWAVAHVLAQGVNYKFKTKPGESDNLAALLLPLPSSENLMHVLRAWEIHGPTDSSRGLQMAKAWTFSAAWAAELAPTHVPAVHALVQSCLPEGGPPTLRWTLEGAQHLAAAAWTHAEDFDQRVDLWAVVVMSPSVDQGEWFGMPGTPVWRRAVEQAPPEFWARLPETRAWSVLRDQLEQKPSLWAEVQARTRESQAQEASPADTRRRARPRS